MYRPTKIPVRELDDQEIEERQEEMFSALFDKMDTDKFFEILTETEIWDDLCEALKKGDANEYFNVSLKATMQFLTPSREEAAKSIRYDDKYGERLQNGTPP